MAITVVLTMVLTVLSRRILRLKDGLILERKHKLWVVDFLQYSNVMYLLSYVGQSYENSKKSIEVGTYRDSFLNTSDDYLC